MAIMMPWPFPDERPRSNRQPVPADLDTTLRQQVTERLRQHPGSGMRTVTVHTQHGVVMLGGTVTDRAVRENAGRIARQVSGVRDVCNMVTVSAAPAGTPSTQRADTADHRQQNSQPERTAFEDITADLIAQDPGLAHPVKTSPDLAVRTTLAVVAGIAWALISVLLVTTTWLALTIVGAVLIFATAVHRSRRKPQRHGRTQRRLRSGADS